MLKDKTNYLLLPYIFTNDGRTNMKMAILSDIFAKEKKAVLEFITSLGNSKEPSNLEEEPTKRLLLPAFITIKLQPYDSKTVPLLACSQVQSICLTM